MKPTSQKLRELPIREADRKALNRIIVEVVELEEVLVKLRNFVVKAEGHWLYGERWTDWVDSHLPKEKLIE